MREKTRQRLAEAAVDAVRRELPPVLREAAEQLPVGFRGRPQPEADDPDVAEDTLGLFVGPAWGENDGSDPTPPVILLYLDNLEDYAEGDPDRFQEEVRLTYLHELGHYLGLEEDGLTERGLA